MIQEDVLDAEQAYLPENHIAGKNKRVLNFIIDSAVIILLCSPFIFLSKLIIYIFEIFGLNIYENQTQLDVLAKIIIVFIYFFLMEISTQQTVGKILTGTKVMDTDGYMPGPVQILKRTLIRLIFPEILSFLWGGNFHDRYSGTLVAEVSRF